MTGEQAGEQAGLLKKAENSLTAAKVLADYVLRREHGAMDAESMKKVRFGGDRMAIKSGRTKSNTESEAKPHTFAWKGDRWFDETSRQEYVVPNYEFRFEARDLVIHHMADAGHLYDAPGIEKAKLSTVAVAVTGIAELDGKRLLGSSIREMNHPENEARRFSLDIREASLEARETDTLLETAVNAGDQSASTYRDFVSRIRQRGDITANVGYSEGIAELALGAKWFLDVRLPSVTLTKLLDAIRQNRAHAVFIGVTFANLFGYIPYHASMGTKLYLAPGLFPDQGSDIGLGFVSSISWRETPMPLETDEDEPAPPPVDPLVKHHEKQAETLAQIATHLKWLLLVAISAIVILLVKR